MGIVIRQSLKATIIQYVGIGIGYLNTAILFPWILTPAQVGLIFFLLNSAKMLTPFSMMGMGSVVIRFAPYFESKKEVKGFNAIVLSVVLIFFSLTAAVLFFGRNWFLKSYQDSSLVLDNAILILPMVLALTLVRVWAAIIRNKMQIVWPNLIEHIFIKGLIAISVLLFALHLIGFDSLVIIYTGCFLFGGILMLGMATINFGYTFSFNLNWVPKSLVKPIAAYGIFNVLTVIGYEVINSVSVVMLSAMRDLENAAIFGIAFTIGNVIDMPLRSVGQITAPMVAKSWKENKLEKIEELYTKSSINLIILGSLIFLCIWTNVDNIFAIIPNGERYIEGKSVVLFIGLGNVFSMLTGINNQVIANSRYYYFNLVSILTLAGAVIGLNFLLIPELGITGAAIASASSLIIFNAVKYLFILWKFKLQPFTIKTLYAILFAGAVFMVIYLLPYVGNPFIDILVKCGVIGLFYFIITYFTNLSEDIRISLHKNIKRFFKR